MFWFTAHIESLTLPLTGVAFIQWKQLREQNKLLSFAVVAASVRQKSFNLLLVCCFFCLCHTPTIFALCVFHGG